MPTIDMDGSTMHYEVSGSGPPVLMMAPGGSDSALEKWSTTWPWQHFLPPGTLAWEYACVVYDGREAGQSGHRPEQLTWAAYPDYDYWDVHLESQPPDHVRDRILDFVADTRRRGDARIGASAPVLPLTSPSSLKGSG